MSAMAALFAAIIYPIMTTVVKEVVKRTFNAAADKGEFEVRRLIKSPDQFKSAIQAACRKTLEEVPDTEKAERVFKLFDERKALKLNCALAEEIARIPVFSEEPDMEWLIKVCVKELNLEKTWKPSDNSNLSISRADLENVFGKFLENMRYVLLNQEEYRESIFYKEILHRLEQAFPIYENERVYRMCVKNEVGSVNFIEVIDFHGKRCDLKEIYVPLHTSSASAEKPTSLKTDLKTTKKVVILGEAGAGKTTLLKHLACLCADEEVEGYQGLKFNETARLPIFIHLREFVSSWGSVKLGLVEYLYKQAQQIYSISLPKGFFERILKEGSALICLDGLDEVQSLPQRKKVVDIIGNFIAPGSPYAKNVIVLTSRPFAYHKYPLDTRYVKERSLDPLNEESLIRIIRNWYKYGCKNLSNAEIDRRVKRLLRIIEKDFSRLLSTPLFVAMLLILEVPDTIKVHDIIEKYIDLRVHYRDWIRSLPENTTSEHVFSRECYRFILERLAHELQCSSSFLLRYGDLELKIPKFTRLDNAPCKKIRSQAGTRSFVSFEQSRIGLLKEFDSGDYGFSVDLFREYLAAWYIVNRDHEDKIDAKMEQIWDFIDAHTTNPSWQGVIAFVLAISTRYSNGFEILAELFLPDGNKEQLSKERIARLNLVIQSIRMGSQTPPVIKKKVFKDLFRVIESNQSRNLIEPFEILSWIGKDEDEVRRKLKDIANGQSTQNQDDRAEGGENKVQSHASHVRFQAAQTLSKIGFHKDGIKCLKKIAYDPEVEEDIQYRIAEEFSILGESDKADEILLNLVQFGIDVSIRINAADSLLEHGIQKGLQILGLDVDLDEIKRLEIAKKLEDLGNLHSASEIYVKLSRDSSAETSIREEAAGLLMKHGNFEGWVILSEDSKLGDDRRYDAAKKLYQHHKLDECKSVAWVLCKNATCSYWKIQAAKLLMKMNEPKGCLALVQGEESIKDKCEVAEALFERGIIDLGRTILLDYSLGSSNEKEDRCIASNVLLQYSENWLDVDQVEAGFDTLIRIMLSSGLPDRIIMKAYNLLRGMEHDNLLMNLDEFIDSAEVNSLEREGGIKFREQIQQGGQK